MKRWPQFVALLAQAVFFCLVAQQTSAQSFSERFQYYGPGDIVHRADPGIQDRRVFFPDFPFPIKVGPEAGADGQPLRAYANSQVYIPQGFGTNDARLYVYPWGDTLCESKHNGGPMPLCPNRRQRGHQGVDIRPNSPDKEKYDVIAVADGTVADVTDFTYVKIRFNGESGAYCEYEHLNPIFVSRGDTVTKGQVIGKVSNIMRNTSTSIHLHFQCEARHPDLGTRVKMPIYTSLITAYRKAWGLSSSVEAGALLRDPERELQLSDGSSVVGHNCDEPLAAPVAGSENLRFAAKYDHNCSEVGLVAGDNNTAKIVYIRPKISLAQAVQRHSVLANGTRSGNSFSGEARSFNKTCNDPEFSVRGTIDATDTEFLLTGQRNVLDSNCQVISQKAETLRFVKLSERQPEPPPITEPTEVPSAQNCPFGLPAGQAPVVVGGVEFPPKSERSCNFTAITVPGGLSFENMPRYIREFPGIKRDVLTDHNHDQIITFNSAEAGIGAWWYWLVRRAVNGANLETKGFGTTGKPTISEVARAIAGRDRSEDFVRRIYLIPYIGFAREYFGHTVDETFKINLADADARWNLARTMFRLESGRTPVVSLKQFLCGIDFGTDILADFDRAGVETGSRPVIFAAFKGLRPYTETCRQQMVDGEVPPNGGTGNDRNGTADIRRKLEASLTKIASLQVQLGNLQAKYDKLRKAHNAGAPRRTPRSTPRTNRRSQSMPFRAIVRSDIYH